MNNAEKFKQIFGLYATELWSMPESDFLEWLNRDVGTTQPDHTADIGKKAEKEDCISRQAALDAIMGQPPEPHYPSWYAAQIEKLPAVQPEQHWIPCSERLPEENGQYLITVRYKHVDGYEDVYAEHGDWCDGNWDMFCFGHCGEVESIPAWMPLPEPYRGGEK